MNMSEARTDDARDVIWLETEGVFAPGTIVDGSSWYHWAPPGLAEDDADLTTLRIPVASAA
jgi:hypothetical protein